MPRSLTVLLLLCLCSAPLGAQETIVAIRHGEKPAAGLGQLSCKGLNRALALPRLLQTRFGKPDALYAPNPAQLVHEGSVAGAQYAYVRPLVTLEPTAIAFGLPVQIQLAYADIAGLQAALTAPANAHALIFVAWEHDYLNRFAQQMLKTYGLDPKAVPDWPGSDYGRIYVFRLDAGHGKPRLRFTIEREGLAGKLSDACPAH
jgi:hypothetical protein